MKEKIEKTFVPHGQDLQIPQLLQVGGAITMMLIGVGVLLLVTLHSSFLDRVMDDQSYAAVIASVMVDQTNDERTKAGLPELELDPVLVASAQLKANDMAENSYFAHTSPSGVSPWFWFTQAGYKFNYAGENLAVNFKDSAAVTKAWMNSPTHRANIENANFSEIGIATAVGRYKGKRTTFVTQHFGDPFPVNGFDENEILSLRNPELNKSDTAINRAERLIASAGSVSWVDRLLVQPTKLYQIIYGLMLFIVVASATNALIRMKDKRKRYEILKYSGMTIIVLIGLYCAVIAQFNTQVIATSVI